MVSVSVSTGTCVGAGQCVLSAPLVFDQDDDGIVTVLDPAPSGEAADAARVAGAICPSRSITVGEG